MCRQKFWIITGGVFGFTGVVFGAFGAHALKNILAPEMLEIFKTGVFYQMIHAAVILTIGLTGINKFFRAAFFLSIGIILFSFSLYLYALTSVKFLSMITPLGGVAFLTGWLLLIFAGFKYKSGPLN
ncbi:MAG TPA: DUF423 domain-containing protein [Ignavibacteria bacterium]|nr:DUF423 domain-containing protein [Bacteroidota bacterium]HRI85557.1 DUF423 domain-containing protein [Ignavibacteria bacterium]HRK00271.1 DUF423 domain-containing protein [Ignavibacteria bacterium]